MINNESCRGCMSYENDIQLNVIQCKPIKNDKVCPCLICVLLKVCAMTRVKSLKFIHLSFIPINHLISRSIYMINNEMCKGNKQTSVPCKLMSVKDKKDCPCMNCIVKAICVVTRLKSFNFIYLI